MKAAGRVKKGGAGGKFTWGGLMASGMDRTASPIVDRNDPNYESGDDAEMERITSVQSQHVKQYKQLVSNAPILTMWLTPVHPKNRETYKKC